MSAYQTLGQRGEVEFVDRKSRFLGHARPVSTEEEALAFLDEMRRAYRDASHNCYAYTLGKNMGVMRYSDDGEPGGTAGLPMMEVIKQRKVCDCAVVVTRYFGGVLLGAGGLVRAHSHTTALALTAARIVTMEESEQWLCEVPYTLWDPVQHLLRGLPVQLLHTEFTAAVAFTLLVRKTDSPRVTEELQLLTNGRVEMLLEETSFRAWEAEEQNA